jgi:hypothetical protein
VWEFFHGKGLYSFFSWEIYPKRMGHLRNPCPYFYFIFFPDCILHMYLM